MTNARPEMTEELRREIEACAARGMSLAVHARRAPERLAVGAPSCERTYRELNARCNQLARALRAGGLRPGDGVALICGNRPEFAEVLYAGLRSGLRTTPINFHLKGDEIAYIVENCEARARVADARFADAVAEAAALAPAAKYRLAVGGPIDGFEPYEEALEGQQGHDLEDPVLGGTMLYTSGTTGRPKGVYRRETPLPRLDSMWYQAAIFDLANDCSLCTGPLYHAAPLAFDLAVPLLLGLSVRLMERFDAREALQQIEQHRITHTHMVPTMFHRLLALPEEVRSSHDVSSLRYVLHGAAPCPVHVKSAMLDWFGPIIHEYYAATEGGSTFIGPEEWRRRPGSVGRVMKGQDVVVLDAEGNRLPAGEIGAIYIKAPDVGRFEYFKAPEKTAGAYRVDHFTLGDMGYFDEDGFLFVTGRTAELIISGGVNIYPAEVDEVLLMHPAVADVATVGVPDEEWGDSVKSVVLLEDGVDATSELAEELRRHCREHLAHYKCPRSVDFTDRLPRTAAGKLQRHKVRARYTTPT